MIDVFFCSVSDKGSFRHHIAEACYLRWKKEQLGHIYWLSPKTCTPAEFQRERRVIAEERATTPIYVCADDDCLPQPWTFVEMAVNIMERHPQFWILSLWPSNCTIHRWTPDVYLPHEDDEVLEHVSVGGVRFMRKGVVPWPKLDPSSRGYDSIHCTELRRNGFRVGYFKDIKMNHVGEGYSTVWK